MFGKPHTLFSLFGFKVRVDWSWILILVLVVWSLARGVFPTEYPDLPSSYHLWMGLAAALGLFMSIIFHELCHSLVARRYGLPMRGITLFVFGGVAEMTDEPPSPKAEFLMALAGPVASAFAGAGLLGLYQASIGLGAGQAVQGVLRWLGIINIVLVVFNSIPGFPLDGGRMLRAVIWHRTKDLRRATRIAAQVGKIFGLVLVGLGILQIVFGFGLGGLWWILIGLFIRFAASKGYEQVLVRQALSGRSVRQFMSVNPISVSHETSLEELVDSYVYRHHFKLFPVVHGGELVGCVTVDDVKEIPRERWGETSVEEIARPCTEENSIQADADAMDALQRMSRNHSSRLVVKQEGHLEGMLSLKDLMEFISLNLELEGDPA